VWKRYQETQAAAKRALVDLVEANDHYRHATDSLERGVLTREKALRAIADPAIGDFIAEMEKELAALHGWVDGSVVATAAREHASLVPQRPAARLTVVPEHALEPGWDWKGKMRQVGREIWSDLPGRQRYMEALRAAVREAEALRLEAVDDVAAALEAIRAKVTPFANYAPERLGSGTGAA
jgi:hypothetical protein